MRDRDRRERRVFDRRSVVNGAANLEPLAT